MKRIIFLILFVFISHELVLAQTKITVDGIGKTCTEARNDALRNAINKAYGSLIYSTTEINNEKLISDEINMLTSGNILSYEEIKTCSESNGKWSIKLSVNVSQTELRKFIEGKGKSIAISGELLKQKIDQEMTANRSELAIIKSLLFQLESFINDPFDYEISIGKVTIKDGKYCDMPAEINVKSNINFYNSYLKLSKEMEKISINKTDQDFRSETLKELYYPVEINSKLYYLRNKESFELIKLFYSIIISKLDDYMIVDGCLNELSLKENNNIMNLKENILFFPEPGFISKTIYGNYKATIEEIGSLDRINIFSSYKAKEYKQGKSLNAELNLMNYSETNPIEFKELKNNLLVTLENLTKEKENGSIKLIYNINYSNEGVNKSSVYKMNLSHNKFKQIIESSIKNTNLNPSKLCGNFINTTDSINLNFTWETYSSRFVFKNGSVSDYAIYLNNKSLPYGVYKLIVKEKELNDNKYKDVFISDYSTRGPLTAFYSLFMPGWGTRRISYNYRKGWSRFALVATPLALSIVSNAMSNNYYNKYMSASDQTEIDKYFSSANAWNKSSFIFAGLGATFYVYEFMWVFRKGLGNLSKKQQIKNKIKNSEFQIQAQPLI
jgi:hypothetical protein